MTDAAPLAARVIVNRVWKHHFGRGLVDNAQRLRHAGRPALASRTARRPGGPLRRPRLVAEVAAPRDHALGDVSAGQRAATPRNRPIDPDNRWLWRMTPPPARCRGLARRDAGATGGDLDLRTRRAGGRPGRRGQPSPHALRHASSARELTDLLRLHDFPDPVDAQRRTAMPTTTPLQQLFVLNSPLIRQRRRRRLLSTARARGGRRTTPTALRWLYRELFSARATAERDRTRSRVCRKRVRRKPAASRKRGGEYGQVLLGSNEFLFVD